MPSPQENFRNYSLVGYDKIEGLASFKNSLEKHFFSEVVIRDYSSEPSSAKLVLELTCNFGLTEMLHHLTLGTWGNFESSVHSFSNLLETLRADNDLYIEIEEFSIYLEDTSLIISKIYEESIPEQLEALLLSVSEHYVHFTKSVTEVPYEIFLPVFKENLVEKDTTAKNIKAANNSVNDYFKYWGVYFHTEEDALVYDVKNTSIISGDLKMLND